MTPRGGFYPLPDDNVPILPGGDKVETLVLVGNVGSDMWHEFQSSDASKRRRNPLDGWSERVITVLAKRLDAHPFFPFSGPPYLPFQRWAQRGDPVKPSPIGPLIHPEYGLWHAYRGALAFPTRIELPPRRPIESPCETCAERPCLSTCPVEAFSDNGYDVPACVAHIGSADGTDCREQGCRARRSCPIGQKFHYLPAQAEFHMRAFLRANRELANNRHVAGQPKLV